MQTSESKVIEPYRIFFPISIFGAIIGVSLWILTWIYQKQWINFNVNSYPILHHINIMTALFLLPVIKGFIFTAIPRFTATDFLTLSDIVFLSILQFLIFTFVLFFENSFVFYVFQSLDFGILFLLVDQFEFYRSRRYWHIDMFALQTRRLLPLAASVSAE